MIFIKKDDLNVFGYIINSENSVAFLYSKVESIPDSEVMEFFNSIPEDAVAASWWAIPEDLAKKFGFWHGFYQPFKKYMVFGDLPKGSKRLFIGLKEKLGKAIDD